jgi:glycosyltransferase involved in cell wall biosynthesis
VLEALSTNLPVVTSDVGEPPVLARSYGLVFRSEDSRDLARALTQLASEHEAALAKASQGHAKAATFDYRQIVPCIERVYERVLSARSGAGGRGADGHES